MLRRAGTASILHPARAVRFGAVAPVRRRPGRPRIQRTRDVSPAPTRKGGSAMANLRPRLRALAVCLRAPPSLARAASLDSLSEWRETLRVRMSSYGWASSIESLHMAVCMSVALGRSSAPEHKSEGAHFVSHYRPGQATTTTLSTTTGQHRLRASLLTRAS